MKKNTIFTIIIFLFTAFLQAGESFQTLPNVYVGVGGNGSLFAAGGLDGEEYYTSGSNFIFPVYIPEAGYGWGIKTGYQNAFGLSFEMGVVQTYHNAYWKAVAEFDEVWILSPGEELDSLISNSVFYIDIKRNYLLDLRFQPYWRGGLGFNGTSSKIGYIGSNEELKGGFAGASLRAGGGLEICISPKISICLDSLYQLDIFTSAEWSSGNASIEPFLWGHEIKLGLWGVYRYSL